MSYKDKLKPISATTTQPGYASKLKPLNSVMSQAPAPVEKKDGFLKSIVKDAAKSLVVQPVDRATEAVTRIFAPNSIAAKGYQEEGPRNVAGIDIEQQRSFDQGGLKQIGGEALKTASWMYGGGAAPTAIKTAVKQTVPGASKTLFKGTVRDSAKEGAKVGAVGGGAYGAGEEMTKEDSTAESVLGAGAAGAALGGLGGGAIGTAVPYATKILNPAEKAAKRAEDVTNSLRRVATGKKGFLDTDAQATQRALREIDLDGVETNADLISRIDEKIKNVSEGLDGALATDTTRRNLRQLVHTTNVNGQPVRHNFVEEAIDQLEKEYTKTNNIRGTAQMRQLREKAMREGLTVQEINDLSKIHGKDLSGFSKLTNELSSGLAKQAAENTRKGLKDTARTNFGNKVAEEADRVISDLSRVKKLASDRVRELDSFLKKNTSLTFRQKASNLIEQAINIASLGSSRALMAAVAKGGKAVKTNTLSAMDLEKRLTEDLKLIQEAVKKGASEDDIISKLQQFIKNNGEKPVLLLEAPKPSTLFATPGGKITPIAQEASDVAAVEMKKAKVPKQGPLYQKKVREIQDRLEPYLTPEEMQVVQMGPKGKSDLGLPDAQTPPDVYTPPQKVRASLEQKLERYLTPDEMEIIDWGPKTKKKKKSLNDIYID